MDWIRDLLTTWVYHLELQVITALSLISRLYKSPQHPLNLSPACCIFNSLSLAAVSNSGDSSASQAHVVTIRRISRNITQSAGMGSSLYSLGADQTENTASNSPSIKELRFSRRWLWRMPISGMWRRVVLVWTDVSEERIASIFRIEKSAKRNHRELVAADIQE
jgi:hypothetical protein